MSKAYSIGTLVLLAAAIGCGGADFSGSSDVKATPPDESTQTTKVSFDGGMMVMSVSAQLTPPPRVKMPSVDLFNQALYLKLECEALSADQGDCVDPDDAAVHYPLSSLALTLTSFDRKTSVLDQMTVEKLSSLDFSQVPSMREIAPGAVEYGPIPAPSFGDEGHAVVVRSPSGQAAGGASSFRVFVLKSE